MLVRILQGRVLIEALARGSTAFSCNVRWPTAAHWDGAGMEVSFHGVLATVRSGHDGNFEVNLLSPKPFPQPVVLVGDSGENEEVSHFMDRVLFKESGDAAVHAASARRAAPSCVAAAFPGSAPVPAVLPAAAVAQTPP
jgi:hypothetical protein